MAIDADALIDVFGTMDSVDDGSTSSVANAAFSVAADITTWTNDDDAPLANFILKCQWATVTGVTNKTINLYARPMNVDSTDDTVSPGTSLRAILIGAFKVYAASASTNYTFVIADAVLPNIKASQEYEFYLENLSGQTISSGWTLKVMPKSKEPHP